MVLCFFVTELNTSLCGNDLCSNRIAFFDCFSAVFGELGKFDVAFVSGSKVHKCNGSSNFDDRAGNESTELWTAPRCDNCLSFAGFLDDLFFSHSATSKILKFVLLNP